MAKVNTRSCAERAEAELETRCRRLSMQQHVAEFHHVVGSMQSLCENTISRAPAATGYPESHIDSATKPVPPSHT
jgi:hypothetical protein